MLRNLSIKSWERIIEIFSIILFILIVGGSVAFNLLFRDMPELNWQPLANYSDSLVNKAQAFSG